MDEESATDEEGEKWWVPSDRTFAFWEAIKNHDAGYVASELAAGFRPGRDGDAGWAVREACHAKDPKILEMLFDAGYEIKADDCCPCCPLTTDDFLRASSVEILRLMVGKGKQCPDEAMESLLHYPEDDFDIFDRDWRVVECLVEAGADASFGTVCEHLTDLFPDPPLTRNRGLAVLFRRSFQLSAQKAPIDPAWRLTINTERRIRELAAGWDFDHSNPYYQTAFSVVRNTTSFDDPPSESDEEDLVE